MDFPVLLEPGDPDLFFASQFGASGPNLAANLIGIMGTLVQGAPDAQLIGYELAGAGDGGYLATLLLSRFEESPPIDGLVIPLATAFAFGFDVGDGAQDEQTGRRFVDAGPGAVPPASPVVANTAQTFQVALFERVALILGHSNFELACFGVRVAGHSNRRFCYLTIVNVIDQGGLLGPAPALEALAVRADREGSPLGRAIAERARILRAMPEETRAKVAARSLALRKRGRSEPTAKEKKETPKA